MKLIIAGSTGFVATEIIRQALADPRVTSIVALARRETPAPPHVGADADTSKLKPVVCSDFENYPEDVKLELQNADACIWTIGITPSQLRSIPWDETCKICHDFTLAGLRIISQLPRGPDQKPLRFIYIGGDKSERDQTKKPLVLKKYSLMRGKVESDILKYAAESNGAVEASIVKPGLIMAEGKTGPFKAAALAVMRLLVNLPQVRLEEIAAVLLDLAINGSGKETLKNEDLVRSGRELLSGQKKPTPDTLSK